ncbi:MAG: hypothetical protein CVV49_21770 [Spirochaetae bacterium HGW-Spirochaetae-5]|nr:MAG: hypothetical protein CVV49_21770 [Spirochaetae bacterium HGW-Spirochaetae-5]
MARWNLKEAGGKFLVGGTRTSSGTSCRSSLHDKTKSNKLSRYNSVNEQRADKKGKDNQRFHNLLKG